MGYIYSATHNAFFPVSMLNDYENNGWDLSDGKHVDESVFAEFTNSSEKKVRVAGDDGFPLWIDTPLPTREESIAAAEIRKNKMLDDATKKIIPWQIKLLIGREINSEETISLNAWLDHIDQLRELVLSDFPDVNWPEVPGE